MAFRIAFAATIAFGIFAISFDLDGSRAASGLCLFAFIASGLALVITTQPRNRV